jgi:hypothetical protein
MAANVSGSARPVLIDLPGYGSDRPDDFQQDETKLPAPVYSIPPVVWVVLFLVIGYLGIRWIMED